MTGQTHLERENKHDEEANLLTDGRLSMLIGWGEDDQREPVRV